MAPRSRQPYEGLICALLWALLRAIFGHYLGSMPGAAEKAEDWEALQRTPNVPELCKNRSRNFLLQMLKPAEKS